jgi:hypothetical protein
VRSQTIRATATAGVLTYPTDPLDSERIRGIPMWRLRYLYPELAGVSRRFQGMAVDMTGRLVTVRP